MVRSVKTSRGFMYATVKRLLTQIAPIGGLSRVTIVRLTVPAVPLSVTHTDVRLRTMFSKSNTVAQAQMAESRFQAAVIEPTEQATASRPSQTASVLNIPPAMPLQGEEASIQGLIAEELWFIEAYNKQHSVEQTVAPGLDQTKFGEGSSGGEERQTIEPQTASVKAKWSYKARKSAKNPTPATTEKEEARAIASEKARLLREDPRTADEIYGTDGPVTAVSHTHTFSVQFKEHGLAMDADFMGVRSFQNCLERYIGSESPDKQRSAHRTADTLRRIVEKNPIPPPHYPRDKSVCANWGNEVRSKWVTRNGKAHKVVRTKGKADTVEDAPEMPTEEWYALLAQIHHDHGHLGRDKVFENVQSITPSISKCFVAAYVSCCCLKRKSSPRKVNVREAFAGEELAKTGKPSKGKKRAIEAADPDSLSPVAKRPKVHSTEPAMVNAGDEQDPSLRNDYSPARKGVALPIAMADPYHDVAGPVEKHRKVIAHQAAPQIPEGSKNASAFDVTGIAAAAPVVPGSESTPKVSRPRPEDIYGSGAEDWQGDDGDWLMQPAPDASELSSLGESIHTQAAASEQASQDMIDPLLLAIPAQGDNTSHPQSNNASDPGLLMGLEDPSVDIHGNISDEEFSLLLEEM
ncbi:hypothetical protein V500_10955 [Pseudogymnoascus sp. VKM F-4518 (FW-2643)]|nr:hypothetical protein V500_10955 [Pseudogymnoascus sp. VKM F-4518 (FW-2643)]